MSRIVVSGAALEQLLLAAAASPDEIVRMAAVEMVRTGTSPAPPSTPWLSLGQAADRFGVNERTVRRAVDRGEWPHRRIGRRLLVASSGPARTQEDTPMASAGRDRDGG